MVNKGNGKCVDARAAASANGTAVQQFACNGTAAQQWRFDATSGGYFRAGTAPSVNQVWDVSNVSTADNAAIHLWLYGGGNNFATLFVNSLVITLPAVIIPITLALLAAYAFAWIKFPGRNILFVAVFALQIVPIQVTLIPLLTLYVDAGLAEVLDAVR